MSSRVHSGYTKKLNYEEQNPIASQAVLATRESIIPIQRRIWTLRIRRFFYLSLVFLNIRCNICIK